jgi:acid stress chaperone HdeB
MKRIGVVVTAIALAMVPALAADKTIPLATMTCKQFVDSPKDTIGVILTWMMGYLQDEDEPAEVDFSKVEDLGKKLGTYCGQNPTHGVMRALDKVSDADDDADVLKSVVGLWTYGDKQVLDRGPARRFSHAMSHRSRRIGVLFERSVPRPEHPCLGKDLGRRPDRAGEGCDQADGQIRVFLLQAGRQRPSPGALCGDLKAPARPFDTSPPGRTSKRTS